MRRQNVTRTLTLIKSAKQVRTVSVDSRSPNRQPGQLIPGGKLLAFHDGMNWGAGIAEELYLLPNGERVVVMNHMDAVRLDRNCFRGWKIADRALFESVTIDT